jgi:hypothetical protein
MGKGIAFHGFEPEDFIDEVFEIELRFEQVPDAQEIKRLGAAWAIWDGAAEVYSWAFCGPFAYAAYAPRRSQEQQSLVALQDWLAQHGGQIVEAVFLSAPIDAQLTPGPARPGSSRPVDPALDEPSPHPAVGEGAEQARDQASREALQDLLTAAAQQRIGLRAAPPSPAPPPLPDWLACLGSESRMMLVCGQQQLGWISELNLTPLGAAEGLQSCFSTWFALRSNAALLGVQEQPLRYTPDNSATVLLKLSEGHAQQVWRADNEDQGFHCAAWLDDGTALVRTNKRLVAVDLVAGEVLSEVKVKSENRWLAVGEAGRLVAVERSAGINLYAWQRPKLKRLAVYKHKQLRLASTVADHVRLHVGPHHLDLSGVNEVLSPKKKATR